MIKNIFFWGAKYKAGIIYDLIKNNKIKEDTKNLFVKYLFDPGLDEAKFKSKAKFSNKKENLEEFKRIVYDKVKELHIERFPYNQFLYEDYTEED